MGAVIHRQKDLPLKKLFFIIAIAFDAAILISYKSLQSLDTISGKFTFLTALKIHSEYLYPVGLSFYTYECISYVTDIYKNKITPRKYFSEYFYFISYFPHLLAGPIIKPDPFFKEFDLGFTFDIQNLKSGVFRFFVGLIKKVLLADMMGRFWIDEILKNPHQFHQFDIAIGCFGGFAQIYFDLSGYTDMAIGISNCFGITLPENFRSPFMAANASEFWRHWHISLSNWFREYIYNPLILNKNSNSSKNVALLITMMLIGLWHGITMQQILWGVLQGFFILFSRYMGYLGLIKNFAYRKAILCALTVSSIAFTLGLYKSTSFLQTFNFYNALTDFSSQTVKSITTPWWGVLAIAVCFFTQWLSLNGYKKRFELFFRENSILYSFILILGILTFIYMTDDKLTQFVYFSV